MWYQISQPDAYLLQSAISALRHALYQQKAEMPTFSDLIDRDLADLDRLSRYLYDSGQRWPLKENRDK